MPQDDFAAVEEIEHGPGALLAALLGRSRPSEPTVTTDPSETLHTNPRLSASTANRSSEVLNRAVNLPRNRASAARSTGLLGIQGRPTAKMVDIEIDQPSKVDSTFPLPSYLKHSFFTDNLSTQDSRNHWRIPTRWDSKRCCDRLEMTANGLTVSFRGTGRNGENDAAAVKADQPIPPQCGVYYFEVTIVSKGQLGFIGLGFSSERVALTRLPGWETNSYGYHGDDGNSFTGSGVGQHFGPTFTTDDVIGCGIDWTQKKAFFTKNGVLIGFCFNNLKGALYPSVGLRTPGEVVKVNFGATDFRFDIDHFATVQAQSSMSRILERPIPPVYLNDEDAAQVGDASDATSKEKDEAHQDSSSTLSQIISAYLFHQGYVDSSLAFAQESAARRENLSDLASSFSTSPTLSDDEKESMLSRQRILELIRAGKALSALEVIQSTFPDAVRDESIEAAEKSITFQLLCRQYVEIMIRIMARNLEDYRDLHWRSLTDQKPLNEEEEKANTELYRKDPAASAAARQKVQKQAEQSLMDVDEDALFEEAITLGQQLHATYSKSKEAKQGLLRLSSLLAYSDPRTADENVRVLVMDPHGDRERLAERVNAELLVSQGRGSEASLQQIYEQAFAVAEHIGDLASGETAFMRFP